MSSMWWLQSEFGLSCQQIQEAGVDLHTVDLQLAENFLVYMEKSGHLRSLQREGLKYKNKITSLPNINPDQPFRFTLVIDVRDMINISGNIFCNLLVHEPHNAFFIIQKVIYSALLAIDGMPLLSPSQIQIALQLRSVPSISSYWMHCDEYHGITLLEGIVVSLSKAHKYLRSTVVRCTEPNCSNSKGFRLPQRINTTLMWCNLCGSVLKEDIRSTDIGEQVLGLLLNPSALSYQQPLCFKRYQAVTVCFQDELSRNLQLGQLYKIAGHKMNKVFYALSAEPAQSLFVHRHSNLSFKNFLPNRISNLFSHIRASSSNSPWSFVTALASHIAVDLYPVTAFRDLKMGMLLNLASQGCSQRPIHLLAIGSDSLIAQRLLRRGGQLAQRCVEHFSPALSGHVNGSIHVDDQSLQWVDAGPLAMANNGVCYLGDWSKFSTQVKSCEITSTIESGRVALQSRSHISEGLYVYPLRSSVWTYHYHNAGQIKSSEQNQLRTLINVFGIPYICDDNLIVEEISHYILNNAINRKLTLTIQDTDLQEFLRIISAAKVTLGEEARQLIRRYFVASRRLRPGCLPVGAVETITALAESHARLAMRSEVLPEDVLTILYLYEQSLNKIFGHCFISPPPAGPVESTSHDNFILQAHSEMKEFSVWLNNCLATVTGGNTPFMSMTEE